MIISVKFHQNLLSVADNMLFHIFLSNIFKGPCKDHFCSVSSKSTGQLRRRCRLNVFLVLVLASILFSIPDPFEYFLEGTMQESFLFCFTTKSVGH
jgi:hypothetical protein